jgi:hypothetical protein
MPSLKSFVSAAVLCLAFICCLGAPAKADEILSAILSGANEVPANSSSAVGGVILVLFGNNLEVAESFTELSTTATAVNLFCCVAAGSNGVVTIAIGGFQLAATSTFDQTIDLTLSSIYNPAFLADGGSESVFLSALNAGLVYINVSDTLNPGGEIRGQIEPPTTGGGGGSSGAVPEPSVMFSLVTGLAAIATQLKRR